MCTVCVWVNTTLPSGLRIEWGPHLDATKVYTQRTILCGAPLRLNHNLPTAYASVASVVCVFIFYVVLYLLLCVYVSVFVSFLAKLQVFAAKLKCFLLATNTTASIGRQMPTATDLCQSTLNQCVSFLASDFLDSKWVIQLTSDRE